MAPTRREEAHAELVPAPREAARALEAPQPPATGDLTENGTGWLLGRGDPHYRYAPGLTRAMAGIAGGSGGLSGLWAELLGIAHPSLALSMCLGMVPALGVLTVFNSAMKWAIRRRFERAHAPTGLRGTPDGTAVRIVGTIVQQPTVPSLFRGVPAVLWRNQIGIADETRGFDFWLRLDDGDQALIAVRESILLDHLQRTLEPPACGPVIGERFTRDARLLAAAPGEKGSKRARREAAVGPGDRIEVCGVLHHEAEDAAGPFDRQPRVISVVRAGKGTPLLVRSVPR